MIYVAINGRYVPSISSLPLLADWIRDVGVET